MSAGAVAGWNFAEVWQEVAAVQPEAPAVVHAGSTTSWAEFARRAGGVARWLSAEGGAGTVAICSRNRPEQLVALFAAFTTGARVVNTHYRYLRQELAENWRQSDADVVAFDATTLVEVTAARRMSPARRRWLFLGPEASCPTWATAFPAAESTDRGPAAVHRRPSGDDLVVLFTGGTTGASKGVLWRQDDLFVLLNRTARYRYDEDGGLVGVRAALLGRPRQHCAVIAAPLAHGLGLLTSLSVLSSGGCVALLGGDRFDAAELLDVAAATSAAELVLVGDAHARPMAARLDTEPDRWLLPHLRLITSSGMRWSPAVKTALVERLPGVRCVDVLGSSESLRAARSVVGGPAAAGGAPTVEAFRLDDDTVVLDEAGLPVAHGSPLPGRLAVAAGRGPLGYLDDDEASAATFVLLHGRRWTVLGDWATVGRDGSITLLGRGAGVINTGGEKVYAEEVENVLRAQPSVSDAAVVGVPDPRFGEHVVGLVERGDTRDGVPLTAVRAQLRLALAHYKVPVALFDVPSVGRGQDGKLDRRRLADTAKALFQVPRGEVHHVG